MGELRIQSRDAAFLAIAVAPGRLMVESQVQAPRSAHVAAGNARSSKTKGAAVRAPGQCWKVLRDEVESPARCRIALNVGRRSAHQLQPSHSAPSQHVPVDSA